jgi:hypothetical protein
MRKADIVIFFGKLTANFLEICAECVSLIIAGGRFFHVAGKRLVHVWIAQLFHGSSKRSCVCQSLLPTVCGSQSLTKVLLESCLVEGLAVCQLRSQGKAFGLVMESLVIVEEKASSFERLAAADLVVGPTDDFAG